MSREILDRETSSSDTPSRPSSWMRRNDAIVAVLIISLLCTSFFRGMALDQRGKIVPAEMRKQSVKSLDTYSLVLLLGGLRGPLVMYLWVDSEKRKVENDKEGSDAEIALIKLLQPEFDSVHVYQIWNLAYNISAKMSNVEGKYDSILDALKYANDVNQSRPDNLSITYEIGQVYLLKLSNSDEKSYYINRIRRDTMYDPRRIDSGGNSSWTRTGHQSLLDAAGHIRPDLLALRPEVYASVKTAQGESLNGAELQFLEPFNSIPGEEGGFRYGVPPQALAYNYYKRAQILMAITHQENALYVPGPLIDRAPASALNGWAREEWGRSDTLWATRLLGGAGGSVELLDPDTAPARIDRAVLDEIEFGCHRAELLSRMNIAEYDRVEHGLLSVEDFHSDKVGCMAQEAMARADWEYLEGIAGSPMLRSARLKAAQADYQKAAEYYYLSIFLTATEDAVMYRTFPHRLVGKELSQYNKQTIDQFDHRQYPVLYKLIEKESIRLAARTYFSKYPFQDGSAANRQAIYELARQAQRRGEWCGLLNGNLKL